MVRVDMLVYDVSNVLAGSPGLQGRHSRGHGAAEHARGQSGHDGEVAKWQSNVPAECAWVEAGVLIRL